MNEWILAGVGIVALVLGMGVGGWVKSIFTSKPAGKNDPKA